MKKPFMYLLVFKKPTEDQIDSIRSTFSDFDWAPGFAVEEIVADDLVSNNLLIQFVSFKEFFQKDINSDEIIIFSTSVDSALTGKGQFFGTLYSLEQNIENLDTYFCYLGEASQSRDIGNETFYKVEYSKYSILNKIDTTLENLRIM